MVGNEGDINVFERPDMTKQPEKNTSSKIEPFDMAEFPDSFSRKENHKPDEFKRIRSARNNREALRIARSEVQADTTAYNKFKTQRGRVPPQTVTCHVFNKVGDYRPGKQPTSKDKATTTKLIPWKIVDKDCLLAAEEAVQANQTKNDDRVHRVAVLNMANQYKRGKGPSGGQEENLHRRTNLEDALAKADYGSVTRFFPNLQRSKGYEAGGMGEYAAHYSKNVWVFRGAEAAGYPWLPEAKEFQVDIISSAAYDLNISTKVSLEGEAGIKAYQAGMWKKIYTQIEAARAGGATDLILGAFGCGMFGGDPKLVAELYWDVLTLPQFQSHFDSITFAILNPWGGENANKKAFEEVYKAKLQQHGTKTSAAAKRESNGGSTSDSKQDLERVFEPRRPK